MTRAYNVTTLIKISISLFQWFNILSNYCFQKKKHGDRDVIEKIDTLQFDKYMHFRPLISKQELKHNLIDRYCAYYQAQTHATWVNNPSICIHISTHSPITHCVMKHIPPNSMPAIFLGLHKHSNEYCFNCLQDRQEFLLHTLKYIYIFMYIYDMHMCFLH